MLLLLLLCCFSLALTFDMVFAPVRIFPKFWKLRAIFLFGPVKRIWRLCCSSSRTGLSLMVQKSFDFFCFHSFEKKSLTFSATKELTRIATHCLYHCIYCIALTFLKYLRWLLIIWWDHCNYFKNTRQCMWKWRVIQQASKSLFV